MKKLIYVLVALIFFGTYSCDVIEPPYEEGGKIIIDTTAKKVLLEEFTGFRCGNCPEAGEVAHGIDNVSDGQVIIMSIHAGDLAIPTPFRTYEFRVKEGLDIAAFYNLPATPYGLVNRISYGGSTLLAPSTWTTAVGNEMNKTASVKLELNAGYDEASASINLKAKMKFLTEGTSNYYMVAYIVEDSIIQYQRDDRQADVHVLNFVHNHVLRGSMNGTWGDPISAGDIPAGTEIIKELAYTIGEDLDWIPKQLALIVVVHDNLSKEILQVEKVYLYNK